MTSAGSRLGLVARGVWDDDEVSLLFIEFASRHFESAGRVLARWWCCAREHHGAFRALTSLDSVVLDLSTVGSKWGLKSVLA